MKSTVTIITIFLFSTINAIAQFDTTKVDLIASLSCHISNGWHNDIRIDSEYGGLDYPVIDMGLCNYKTEEDDMNICLSITIFSIEHKDSVLAKDWTLDNSEVEFLYTQNFIVVVDYLAQWNDTYNLLLPDALSGIREFFKFNYGNL